MAKNHNDYFKMFENMVVTSCRAAGKLQSVLSNYSMEDLDDNMKALHKIESEGDSQKHHLMKTLAKEFITPIEREDILQLADEIDDVTDSIEDILLKMYMYNVKEIQPNAIAFSDIIVQCCGELLSTMKEFATFKKSKTIHNSIIEMNRLEETGDQLYIQAVRTLYSERRDPLDTMVWTELYGCFEKCCDTCEHVVDVVEGVIMKNT